MSLRLIKRKFLTCYELRRFSYPHVTIVREHQTISTEHRLANNQEEADTKVLLHCLDSLTCNPGKNVTVRSPSGDVDITVIMTSKLLNDAERVFWTMVQGFTEKGCGSQMLICLNRKKNA